MERNELESALERALNDLESATEDVDDAFREIAVARSKVDRALTRVDNVGLLLTRIKKAIGELPKEKGNG